MQRNKGVATVSFKNTLKYSYVARKLSSHMQVIQERQFVSGLFKALDLFAISHVVQRALLNSGVPFRSPSRQRPTPPETRFHPTLPKSFKYRGLLYHRSKYMSQKDWCFLYSHTSLLMWSIARDEASARVAIGDRYPAMTDHVCFLEILILDLLSHHYLPSHFPRCQKSRKSSLYI